MSSQGAAEQGERNDSKSLLEEAQSEMATLSRVSHRLAMTEAGENLDRVLKLLLPKLLMRIGKNHHRSVELSKKNISNSSNLKNLYDQIHAKLVEMLGHSMNRVRADQNCTLPCLAIVELLDVTNEEDKTDDNNCTTNIAQYKNNVDAFTLNLGLAFLTLGLPRCPMDEVLHLLPRLLSLLGTHSVLYQTATEGSTVARRSQLNQVSHLVLRTIQRLVNENQPVAGSLKRESSSSSPSAKGKESLAKQQSNSSTNTGAPSSTANDVDNKEEEMSPLDRARYLCLVVASNGIMGKHVGAALYELLLDSLLYQPVGKAVVSNREELLRLGDGPPPAGLSSEGHRRLITGPASSSYLGTVKNWYNEHLPPAKLRDFKAAILTFLAPSGRWAIFYPPTATIASNPMSSLVTGMGVARTLALLVVASGDVHGDVAQKGTSYLKMYLDTAKRSTKSSSSTTNNGGGAEADDTTPAPALTPYSIVGAPIPLACELLGLILGGYGTTSIMKKYNANSLMKNIPCLQENHALLTTAKTTASKISYRSPIKEAGAVTIMKFVQSKIFDDEPHLLQQDLSTMNMDNMEEKEGASSLKEGATDHSSYAFILGQMTISVADLMLIQGAKSSGSSNSSHGRSGCNSPKVAAAKMLNSLCVRFLSHYEKLCSSHESEMVAAREQEQAVCYDDVNNEQQQQETRNVRYILSRIFSTACKVLSTASTPHDSGSTYPAEARDSCYGIACVLARSKSILSSQELITTTTTMSLFKEQQSFLFDGSIVSLRHSSSSSEEEVGDQSVVQPGATAMSNVTATLLFGCVANEEESLRIRATAALDALMTAYGRWIKKVQAEEEARAESLTQMEIDHDHSNKILTTETNPWASTPNPGLEETKDSSSSSFVSSGGTTTTTDPTFLLKEQVCRSLMPLLWRAAHTSQTKASRLAAASWSNEVIRPLDVVNATHLLCFLSGDKDDTTSTLARKALRVNDLDEDSLVNQVQDVDVDSNEQQHDNRDKNENTSSNTDDYPEMNDIVKLLLQDGVGGAGGSMTSRPTFYDFSLRAKGTTLRLCLACLLSDFYGGDDDAVNSFMKAIIRTIQTLVTEWMGFDISKTGSKADLVELSNQLSSSSSTKKSSDALELLEDCSVALAGCLTCSTYARQWLARCSSSPSLEGGPNDDAGTQGTSLAFNQQSMALLAVIAPSSKARRMFAKCCGVLYDDIDLWTAKSTFSPSPTESSNISTSAISTWIDQSGISQALQLASETLSVLNHSGETQPTNLKLDKVHGAAHLGSYCVRSVRWNMFRHDETLKTDERSFRACGETSSTIVECLGKGCLHREEMIGNACSDGLNVTFSHMANMVGEDVPLLSSQIRTSCQHALMELSKAATIFGNGERSDSIRVIAVARAIGPTLAATTNVGATTTGDETNKKDLESSSSWQTVRLNCIDSLFNLLGSTSNRNEPEVALVVGEALAKFADAYSPPGIEWTTPSMDKPEVYDLTYAASLPPHEMVIYRLLECELQSSSPQKRTAVAPALLAIVAHAAELTNKGGTYKSRALVNTIVKQLVQIQSSFLLLLKDPKSKQLSRESACLGLAACYGIATQTTNHHEHHLQQKSADEEDSSSSLSTGATNLHTRLLQAFGQTTNFGGSAMMETREQNAARVAQNRSTNDGGTSAMLETMGLEETSRVTVEEGGAAGLGEAALGAYREMASAALALNRPDVLYSLMLLSVTDILWTTPGYRDRYNASTLLGSGGRGSSSIGSHHNIYEIRLALRPHLSNLVPRLLRACHDPSKQTREQIGALWQALTGGGAEARALITEHFLVTFDTLIKDASSKLWRARTGACGALADIIVGRSWEELGGGLTAKSLEDIQFVEQDGESVSAGVRLLMLWRVTTRALDDVRSNVRESGETLARSVSSLTVRLCNPDGESSPGEEGSRSQRGVLSSSKAATGTILPWLVEYGLNQPSAEATGACISCLLGIIETAKPMTLAPVLPSLIGSLTLAISGLEPAALNYLQVRAAGRSSSSSGGSNGDNQEERIERVRLQLAQSGPINAALTKCIDMARHVSLDIQRQVIPQIDNALRCGAGFATRAAAADSVTTLVSTCPESFHFQGSTLSNPTVRLLRALYYASQRERGTMARDRMTHALGSVASIAPGSAVRGLVMKMCYKYKQATGSRDDVSARLTVAYGLRSIAVRATLQFHDGGPRDIWRRQVLPIAFLGLREDNTKIVSLWSDVWEEGGSAVSSDHHNHSGNFADDDDDHDAGGHGGYTLEEKLLPYLVDTCVTALDDVSWSRRRAACIALEELAKKHILAPSPRSSSGDTMMSVGDIKRAVRRAKASCRAITACVKLLGNKRRIWDGKRHLALAIETMVRQWMISPFVSANNNNNFSCPILGWSSENASCPWSPLLCGGSPNDLFDGDGWFLSARNNKTDDDVTTKEQDNNEDTVMMEAQTEDIETNGNPGLMESTQEEETNKDDKDSPLGVEEPDDTMIEEEEVAMEEEEDKDEDTSAVVATMKDENNKQDQEQTTTQIVTFVGVLRLLLEQAFVSETGLGSSTEVLPFKAASLQALSNISSAYRDIVVVNSTSSSSTIQQEDEGGTIQHTNDLKLVFDTLAPKLYEMLAEDDKKKDKSSPPALIVARMLDCYSSILYPNFDEDTTTSTTIDGNPLPLYAQITNLSNMVLDNTNIVKQAAWTVRESSARFAATLATHLSVSTLRKLSIIQMFMKCTTQAISDRKFWKVRKAGLQILVALTYRCRSSQQTSTGSGGQKRQYSALMQMSSSSSHQLVVTGNDAMSSSPSGTNGHNESRLILESLLPQKERILQILRTSLQDTESQVTSVATEVFNAMATWP